jgi:Ca2+-binding EF-hand superfamily protein
MKTFPFSLIAAGILAPGHLMAQTPDVERVPAASPETPVRDGAGKHDVPRPFMEAVDLNHDGFISKEEFDGLPRLRNLPEEKRQNLFKRLDKDEDGKLSREELGRMPKPQNGQGPTMPRLWELDVDKSGGVSMEEFKAGRLFSKLPAEKQEEIFRRLDTDHDGVISPKDKPEHPFRHDGGNPHPGHPDGGKPEGPREGFRDGQRMEQRHIIRQLDNDGDGALSFEEFRVGPLVKDLNEDAQKVRFKEMDRNHDQKISAEDFTPALPREEGKHPKQPEPPTVPPAAPPAE